MRQSRSGCIKVSYTVPWATFVKVYMNVHEPKCVLQYSVTTHLLWLCIQLLHTLPAGIHNPCISRTRHLCFATQAALSHCSTLTRYPGQGEERELYFSVLNNAKRVEKILLLIRLQFVTLNVTKHWWLTQGFCIVNLSWQTSNKMLYFWDFKRL